MSHLDAEDLRLLLESSDASLAPKLIEHLLEVCVTCSLNLVRARAEVQPDEVDHTLSLKRVLQWAKVMADPKALRREAEADLDEMLQLSPEERQRRLIEEDDRFRSPILVELLVRRVRGDCSSDRAEALELARLAFDVSLRVDPELSRNLAAEMVALAAAHKGNVLRCCDQPRLAQGCFAFARRQLALAEGADPIVEAEILSLEASLFTDQRRFKEATRLVRRAERLLREVGETKQRSRVLVKHANLLYYQSRYVDAVEKLRQAAKLVPDDAALALSIQFNLARYLCDAGNSAGARTVLKSYQHRFAAQSGPWTLRLPWLHGRLAQLEGRLQEAERLLLAARDGFLERQTGFDAAEVSLDLALLYLEQGRSEEVQQLAQEMLPIFWSQDVHREALAALALFQRAAREQNLTLELVRELARYLQHARLDRTLSFETFRTTT